MLLNNNKNKQHKKNRSALAIFFRLLLSKNVAISYLTFRFERLVIEQHQQRKQAWNNGSELVWQYNTHNAKKISNSFYMRFAIVNSVSFIISGLFYSKLWL